MQISNSVAARYLHAIVTTIVYRQEMLVTYFSILLMQLLGKTYALIISEWLSY